MKADEKYREFSLKITPDLGKSAGVKNTGFKEVCKKKAAKGDWEEFFSKEK